MEGARERSGGRRSSARRGRGTGGHRFMEQRERAVLRAVVEREEPDELGVVQHTAEHAVFLPEDVAVGQVEAVPDARRSARRVRSGADLALVLPEPFGVLFPEVELRDVTL